MASERLTWMDLVRGICILLVIFLHASYAVGLAGRAVPEAFAGINAAFDPFRIPLLMFLSGMLLQKSLNKPDRAYLVGKFNLIFWPFLVWSLVVYAAEGRLTWEWILKTPISAPSVLWYLWFLTAYYVIALGLVRLRIPPLPVIAASLIASELLPSLLRMDRFAALFVFFLLGHYVMSRGVSPAGRPLWGLAGLAAALAGAVISVTSGAIKYDALFIWVPVGAIAFLLWATQRYRSTPATAPLEWIGRNSIVFYSAHFPLLIIGAQQIGAATALEGAAFYLTVFAAAIASAAAIQVARERVGLVAALFDFRKVPGVARWQARPAPATR